MQQLRLNMRMQCCNPLCHEHAQRGQLYCGDSCYEQVERNPRGHFVSIFKRETPNADSNVFPVGKGR